MRVQSYQQLVVWQKAMDLVVESYRLSATLPKQERFGLIAQIRRAAVSIPANIAEGHARTHGGDFAHHLSIARGSVAELETHYFISERLGFCKSEDLAGAREACDAVSRMLTKLKRKLAV